MIKSIKDALVGAAVSALTGLIVEKATSVVKKIPTVCVACKKAGKHADNCPKYRPRIG